MGMGENASNQLFICSFSNNVFILIKDIAHIQGLQDHKKKAFENIVGKGESASDQHFLLFHLCF